MGGGYVYSPNFLKFPRMHCNPFCRENARGRIRWNRIATACSMKQIKAEKHLDMTRIGLTFTVNVVLLCRNDVFLEKNEHENYRFSMS